MIATHSYRGVTITIGPRTPCPGIGWKIAMSDHLGRATAPWESQGAFYDGVLEHPEGAYAWALSSAKKAIDRVLQEITP